MAPSIKPTHLRRLLLLGGSLILLCLAGLFLLRPSLLTPRSTPLPTEQTQEITGLLEEDPIPLNPLDPPHTSIPHTSIPLILTGEATLNAEKFFFLWDPETQESHMLSFTANPTGDQILTYNNAGSGSALLHTVERPFKKGNPPEGSASEEDLALLAEEKIYWEGYRRGYALLEPYGEMLPAGEDPITGAIQTPWLSLHGIDPILKDLPPDIWEAIWMNAIDREAILASKPPKERDYWRALIAGAQSAILGNTSEAKLSEWQPALNEPAVTSPRQKTVTAGSPFRYQIRTNTPATRFSASPLPPGLTLDPHTGLIQGTPTPPTAESEQTIDVYIQGTPTLPTTESEQTIDVYQTTLTVENENGATETLLEITVLPNTPYGQASLKGTDFGSPDITGSPF